MRADEPRFRQAGGSVALVTMGPVATAARFREHFQLTFPVLTDADQAAYRAFGVGRGGLREIMGVQTWLPGLKALFRGGIGVPRGDVQQLPAAAVVDGRGIVRFSHQSKDSTDHPSHDQMIAAVRAAAAA